MLAGMGRPVPAQAAPQHRGHQQRIADEEERPTLSSRCAGLASVWRPTSMRTYGHREQQADGDDGGDGREPQHAPAKGR